VPQPLKPWKPDVHVRDNLYAGNRCGPQPCRQPRECTVLQGGVRVDGVLVESVDYVVVPGERVPQVGKRRFVRLVPPA
jgi:hypothetical protein